MTGIDYAIIGVIAVSALISLFRGFVREALSLAVWIASIWLAWRYFNELEPMLPGWIEEPSLRTGMAFVLIWLGALLIGGIIVHLLSLIVDKTGLNVTDRFIGLFFGAARGALLVAIIVLLAGLTPMPRDSWWRGSQLLPYFEQAAKVMRGFLPEDVASRFSFPSDSSDS